MTLNYDKLLSSFAYNFDLRSYSMEESFALSARVIQGICGYVQDNFAALGMLSSVGRRRLSVSKPC